MCDFNQQGIRPLIIEVTDSGKVSLWPGAYNVQPSQTLTIEEVTKCRDFLNLIIEHPDNFHIVGDGPPPILIQWDKLAAKVDEVVAGREFAQFKPKCDKCRVHLHSVDDGGPRVINASPTSSICFACEKEGILNSFIPVPVPDKDIYFTSKEDLIKNLLVPERSVTIQDAYKPTKFCPFCSTTIEYAPAYERGFCIVCVGGLEHTQDEYDKIVSEAWVEADQPIKPKIEDPDKVCDCGRIIKYSQRKKSIANSRGYRVGKCNFCLNAPGPVDDKGGDNV